MGGMDYVLARQLEQGAPPVEICKRIHDLCDYPKGNCLEGTGLPTVLAVLQSALAIDPEKVQRTCVSVLCALCDGGVEDAAAARTFANAMLLSDCGKLRGTYRQLNTIQHAKAFSDAQRAKLVKLFRPV